MILINNFLILYHIFENSRKKTVETIYVKIPELKFNKFLD